jgi:ATP-binding cassette subfamily B protein
MELSDSQRRVDRLFGYLDHVRMLWATGPGWSTLCLIAALVTVGCNIINMIAIGQLVAALADVITGRHPADLLWMWFGIFVGAAILSQIAGFAISWGGARVHAAYRVRLNELLAETGIHPRNLAMLEDEVFAERLETLVYNNRTWLLRFGMTGTWEFVIYKLTAIGSAAIVFSWRWWVAILVGAGFLLSARVVRHYLDHLLEHNFEKASDERRRAEYASKLMVHPEAAKEVRLFGLTGWLEDRYSRLWHAFQLPVWRESRRRATLLVAVLVGEAILIGGALSLLAYDALRGEVAVALVTTYVIAILGLESFGPMGDVESGLVRTSVFLRSLFRLRRSIGLSDVTTIAGPPPQQRKPGSVGIEIRDVTFRYPSRTEPTLSNLSLSVPAGQSLAIVGINGAGKSTMIKLIAGLYRPDSGTVRVDGKDPFTDESSRGEVAVVFQDFVHYPLSLRDNVGFGTMGNEDNQAVLDKAITDAAGTEVLRRVDNNWDAVLSNEYDGGTDLSGGQWQRVALARALASVAGGAGVLVLDEPTAALDVRAEAEIFDRFLDMTHGVTTILVSHRLSTVRRAERIVVLDGQTGRISEDGSHDQLLAAGGAYATMFTLQARRFALAGGWGS